MTDHTPLTDEELAEMKDRAARVDPYRDMWHKSLTQVAIDSANDVPILIAELERCKMKTTDETRRHREAWEKKWAAIPHIFLSSHNHRAVGSFPSTCPACDWEMEEGMSLQSLEE